MTMAKVSEKASSAEARNAFVLERAGGKCEYRTEPGCTGIATRVLAASDWFAFGVDGCPVWAVRACCDACYGRWAR
jgi:hypothetical protein